MTIENKRTKLFISKATPGDDAFVLWLAPRLEAFGYDVFADILQLDTGDSWRQKITHTLQEQSVKLLLCCSNDTLRREGVLQEIGIAADLSKSLPDPNFILPLKLRRFKPMFGIVDLQYIDFESGWSHGLKRLLDSLQRQAVPKTSKARIQPEWASYIRRHATRLRNEPELLTSNWLRILSVPDFIHHVAPTHLTDFKLQEQLLADFPYPLVPHRDGFLTFAAPADFDRYLPGVGPFEAKAEISYEDFVSDGCPDVGVEARDSRRIVVHLFRQAWERHCKAEGFVAREFASGLAQIPSEAHVGIGERVSWGRQGQRRNSMLRNRARDHLWEYGVSARAHLFPFPHFRLKARVVFSRLDATKTPSFIADVHTQHRLRRSIAGRWRNRAWHGRLMAFIEKLAGESPYLALPLASHAHLLADAMPVQATSPVSARQQHYLGEDAEEVDETTLAGYLEDEDD